MITGAGCQGASQSFRLPRWSVAGIPLEGGGTIETTNAPEQGKGFPHGSLGADVLARFGAVRLDFKHQQLAVLGKEGPEFRHTQAPRPLPKALVRSTLQITASRLGRLRLARRAVAPRRQLAAMNLAASASLHSATDRLEWKWAS